MSEPEIVYKVQPITYNLSHPELNVQAIATVEGKWFKNGQWRGYELRFADKVRVLTFEEMQSFRAEIVAADEPMP